MLTFDAGCFPYSCWCFPVIESVCKSFSSDYSTSSDQFSWFLKFYYWLSPARYLPTFRNLKAVLTDCLKEKKQKAKTKKVNTFFNGQSKLLLSSLIRWLPCANMKAFCYVLIWTNQSLLCILINRSYTLHWIYTSIFY